MHLVIRSLNSSLLPSIGVISTFKMALMMDDFLSAWLSAMWSQGIDPVPSSYIRPPSDQISTDLLYGYPFRVSGLMKFMVPLWLVFL